jgi:hypothetical protein
VVITLVLRTPKLALDGRSFDAVTDNEMRPSSHDQMGLLQAEVYSIVI